MPKEQSAQSHAAIDPLMHFVLMPIFIGNFIFAVVAAVRAWPLAAGMHLWNLTIAAALVLLMFKTRLYGLANQDRIIRLEERVRIAALVPAADASRLSKPQLIALRFACDGELPALVERTLSQNLEPKTIKESIRTWRPDYERI